jgi:hypothetical protein
MLPLKQIWIGFDPRETLAYSVALASAFHQCGRTVPVKGLRLATLRNYGLYTRPTTRRGGQLRDTISDAPMSTEFAISRFLVPHLAQSLADATEPPADPGWHLFADADVLFRRDPREMMEYADPDKAVVVVQHDHQPTDAVKMDSQAQTSYPRKNWSSVMLLNCGHQSNRRLTVEMVNTLPGRDLHRFCWLDDADIGALPPEWNHLVGVSAPNPDAAIVHYTLGTPDMPGYEGCEFADEWRDFAERWGA